MIENKSEFLLISMNFYYNFNWFLESKFLNQSSKKWYCKDIDKIIYHIYTPKTLQSVWNSHYALYIRNFLLFKIRDVKKTFSSSRKKYWKYVLWKNTNLFFFLVNSMAFFGEILPN